jgi:hypothetical protein
MTMSGNGIPSNELDRDIDPRHLSFYLTKVPGIPLRHTVGLNQLISGNVTRLILINYMYIMHSLLLPS